MRLLLFIPTFILFLANIPFEFEVKMEEAVCEAMMEEMDCGKDNVDSKSSCHKPEVDSKESCHKTASTEEQNDKEDPCMATGITCICICCFQYTAPASGFATIDFNLFPQKITLTGFIHSIWEDPQLSPPWQPPDLV